MWLAGLAWFLASPTWAASGAWDLDCLIQQLDQSKPGTTVETLRQRCHTQPPQATSSPTETDHSRKQPPSTDTKLAKRLAEEEQQKQDRFSLQSHHPNYLMVAGYNHAGTSNTAGLTEGSESLDDVEVEIQLSVKIPLGDNLLGLNDHLYVGYTNRSFWQAYNQSLSSPFRETNHEPEIWIGFENRWDLLGWRNRMIDLGLSHQSNGRSEPYSRSWNRVYLRAVFEKGNSAMTIKPWLRLPDSRNQDDNPDITTYMGHGEVRFMTNQDNHQLSLMGRNNLRLSGENKGAIELGYSYPIHRNLNGYVKWFYGYGESLIDYNVKSNRLSFGVQLGGWL
ncbi:phospholipase [Thiomicrospira sp. WB1]|nr:phospholipase [Thiomicrospira sp. WB1]